MLLGLAPPGCIALMCTVQATIHIVGGWLVAAWLQGVHCRQHAGWALPSRCGAAYQSQALSPGLPATGTSMQP